MIVNKEYYDYLRNKFDLLTNELVKANIELSDIINFVSYMKPQDEQANFEEKEQLEGGQVGRKVAEETCNRMVSYITKLERENEELKEQNDKLSEANLKQFLTIQKRNNEIDALKYMLDREEW